MTKRLRAGNCNGALVAFTSDAQRALRGRAQIVITRFPFRVGRERRLPSMPTMLVIDIERGLPGVSPLNDLYLEEPESPRGSYVSPAHFMIDRLELGFVLIDCHSARGTMVGGKMLRHEEATVGARDHHRRELRATLHDGDLIVVGGYDSPYVFRFMAEPAD